MLGMYIDIAAGPESPTRRQAARNAILQLMADGNPISTKHVLHNIGKRRREWLMEFLNGND